MVLSEVKVPAKNKASEGWFLLNVPRVSSRGVERKVSEVLLGG